MECQHDDLHLEEEVVLDDGVLRVPVGLHLDVVVGHHMAAEDDGATHKVGVQGLHVAQGQEEKEEAMQEN